MSKKSYAYKNDFMYFVLEPEKDEHSDVFIYCSGINIDRFLPITKGRHRPMSNPAIRGLQLINLGVRALVLANGATPKDAKGRKCAGITMAKGSWSTERLLIENVPPSLPDEIISYCVINLLKKTYKAICLPEDDLPETLLAPEELQSFLENQCIKYSAVT